MAKSPAPEQRIPLDLAVYATPRLWQDAKSTWYKLASSNNAWNNLSLPIETTSWPPPKLPYAPTCSDWPKLIRFAVKSETYLTSWRMAVRTPFGSRLLKVILPIPTTGTLSPSPTETVSGVVNGLVLGEQFGIAEHVRGRSRVKEHILICFCRPIPYYVDLTDFSSATRSSTVRFAAPSPFLLSPSSRYGQFRAQCPFCPQLWHLLSGWALFGTLWPWTKLKLRSFFSNLFQI
jgi:hypothetical protein